MNDVRRYTYTLILVAVLLLIVAPLALRSLERRQDCNQLGGEYVRGMWGYECVGDGQP